MAVLAALGLIAGYACYPRGASAEDTITTVNAAYAKRVAQALLAYAADNNEALPESGKWADAAEPYLGTPSFLKPPGRPKNEYRFAFNCDLSQAHVDAIEKAEVTPTIFNSLQAARNAAGGVELFREELEVGFPVIAFADGSHKVIRKKGQNEAYQWTPELRDE